MQFTIETPSGRSDIYCGKPWTEVSELLPAEGIVIVTDENIIRIYGKYFPDYPVLIIGQGEQSKKLSTIDELAKRLIELGIDRSGFILGIGGGVVSDITGFLASVYMRGISFGFISTSLLSQVDASVGGKNGVNSGMNKNMIGTFSQPKFVICDPSMLNTLPDDEYQSGLAELIKMAVILDAGLFSEIEENREKIKLKDKDLLGRLIQRSVELKAKVVLDDERENGIRRILNFGHTFGHVIETGSKQKHGFAVASGMEIASAMSVSEGLLDISEFRRITGILKYFGLLRSWSISPETMKKMISSDKKKEGGALNFILLGQIGRSTVKKFSVDELMALYDRRTSL